MKNIKIQIILYSMLLLFSSMLIYKLVDAVKIGNSTNAVLMLIVIFEAICCLISSLLSACVYTYSDD